jgi:hypothetical protein
MPHPQRTNEKQPIFFHTVMMKILVASRPGQLVGRATQRWIDESTGRFVKTPIVIGENMKRLEKWASALHAKLYTPPFWDHAKTTAALKTNLLNNQAWLSNAVAEGRIVINVGEDVLRVDKRSIYYFMENMMMR